MKKALFCISISGIFLLGFLIITNPYVCTQGAITGLLLCSRVIIPSLFPFTVCVLFIVKSGVLNNLVFLNKFTNKIWGISSQMFAIFLLSLIGGYPLGAKILSESEIDSKTASKMLNYCVNAGPAFIILAVGLGRFNSKGIGYMLFLSHVLSSIILSFVFKPKHSDFKEKNFSTLNPIDNFIISTSQSAATTLNICNFVILFSVIVNYINFYSKKLTFLKSVALFLEITNAVNLSRNIITVSFLLGFGGVCVWCQIFSVSGRIRINYLSFVLSRIFHGLISAALTYLFIKAFKITVPTLSNGKLFTFSAYQNNIAVAISLITMGIVLIISLYSKKCTGNLLEDLV